MSSGTSRTMTNTRTVSPKSVGIISTMRRMMYRCMI